MYFALGLSRDLAQLVAVAGIVGKPDHLVALVVVPQQHNIGAQLGARRGNAGVHRMVRLRKVVIEGTRSPTFSATAGAVPLPLDRSMYSAFSLTRSSGVGRVPAPSFASETGMLKA